MDGLTQNTTSGTTNAQSSSSSGCPPPHHRRDTNSAVKTQAQVEAAQHASLLVVGDMLEHTRNFMLPRFDEVCRAVLALKDHPKALLRLEVVRLIVSER